MSKLNEVLNSETYEHESFGQIRFSRVNGYANFYGSELPQQNYICLEISTSKCEKSLTQEWYFPQQKIMRLRMSAGQFSELITSMNYGSGVPCTFERLNGKVVEEYTNEEPRKEFVHRVFREKMQKFSETLNEKKVKAKEIIQKKNFNKSDVETLSNMLSSIFMEVEMNIPYFTECFQETMDKVVSEAKIEVENAILHKITLAGLEKLHEENNLLGNGKSE
jgi:hypothetical protein